MHDNSTDLDQNTDEWRRRNNKELNIKTGQTIFDDMKARKLKWSNPQGSQYTTINDLIVGNRPSERLKTR